MKFGIFSKGVCVKISLKNRARFLRVRHNHLRKRDETLTLKEHEHSCKRQQIRVLNVMTENGATAMRWWFARSKLVK